MRKMTMGVVGVGIIMTALAYRVAAQDAAPANTPIDIIDRVMGFIGQGRIDDAVNLMDGLKSQPDLKEVVRGQLISLRDQQGQYHGYDIAATQRFTPNFQKIDIIANYDQQPVLFRISFYRPQPASDTKWSVLYFSIHPSVPEIVEILKDTPIDYPRQSGRR